MKRPAMQLTAHVFLRSDGYPFVLGYGYEFGDTGYQSALAAAREQYGNGVQHVAVVEIDVPEHVAPTLKAKALLGGDS